MFLSQKEGCGYIENNEFVCQPRGGRDIEAQRASPNGSRKYNNKYMAPLQRNCT